jgi:branched-chain amino acid transport system ATP-binding protein
VSFGVRAGSLTALIGPNGAGKSTMFNLLTNLYIADKGKIAYFGQDLAGMRSDKIARLGLIRTFQTARVFAGMSVLENVLAGAHIGTHATVWEEALWLPRAASEERTVRDKALHSDRSARPRVRLPTTRRSACRSACRSCSRSRAR